MPLWIIKHILSSANLVLNSLSEILTMACNKIVYYGPSVQSLQWVSEMGSQITSLTVVYSTVYWGADQRKHQSSASLAFVRGIHEWLVNSLHKWPVMWKMFPFDDVIMVNLPISSISLYSLLSIHCLSNEYHIHIWQVSACFCLKMQPTPSHFLVSRT